jgi:hypothetical protein
VAAHPTYEVVNTAAAAARVVVLLAQRIVMTSDRFGIERARLEGECCRVGHHPGRMLGARRYVVHSIHHIADACPERQLLTSPDAHMCGVCGLGRRFW